MGRQLCSNEKYAGCPDYKHNTGRQIFDRRARAFIYAGKIPQVAVRPALDPRRFGRRGVICGIRYSDIRPCIDYSGRKRFYHGNLCVLVPLLMWGLRRKRPSANELIAALLCLAGIGVLSLGGAGALSGKMLGYGLTLLSGVLFALHICLVGVFTDDGDNIMMLTCLQFMFAALFAWTASLLFEAPAVSITPDTWLSLAYVGIAATLIALLLQNIGIKYASPSYASLFLCLEAPFGCIFGVMFLGEKLELRMIVGCAIIVAGLALAQIRKRTNKSPTDKTTGTEVNL